MVVNSQSNRWENMDKSNTDLSVLTRHFEVHNRTEGKSSRTVVREILDGERHQAFIDVADLLVSCDDDTTVVVVTSGGECFR